MISNAQGDTEPGGLDRCLPPPPGESLPGTPYVGRASKCHTDVAAGGRTFSKGLPFHVPGVPLVCLALSAQGRATIEPTPSLYVLDSSVQA